MKNNVDISKPEIGPREASSQAPQFPWAALVTWWCHHMDPPEPPATASILQREKARRGRIASVIVSMLLLALLSLLPAALMSHDIMTSTGILIGAGICALALFLNRRGAIEISGILVLALIYAAQMYIVYTYPEGMTLGRLRFWTIPSCRTS